MKKIKEDPTAMYDDESDKEKKIRLITLLTSSIQEAEFYDAMDMIHAIGDFDNTDHVTVNRMLKEFDAVDEL
tara:strand:+ start:708 stop:923 length:216 start_codon:yes stop_codon:yes gene_type:complete